MKIGALKRGESYALNGMKLHELYFGELGGRGHPSGDIVKAIERQYGTYDRFLKEFWGPGYLVAAGRFWRLIRIWMNCLSTLRMTNTTAM